MSRRDLTKDENTVIECNKYKFIRFPSVSGFIAFDKNKESVGFDEVGKRIDEMEDCIKLLVHTIYNANLEMSKDFIYKELIKEITN